MSDVIIHFQLLLKHLTTHLLDPVFEVLLQLLHSLDKLVKLDFSLDIDGYQALFEDIVVLLLYELVVHPVFKSVLGPLIGLLADDHVKVDQALSHLDVVVRHLLEMGLERV